MNGVRELKRAAALLLCALFLCSCAARVDRAAQEPEVTPQEAAEAELWEDVPATVAFSADGQTDVKIRAAPFQPDKSVLLFFRFASRKKTQRP